MRDPTEICLEPDWLENWFLLLDLDLEFEFEWIFRDSYILEDCSLLCPLFSIFEEVTFCLVTISSNFLFILRWAKLFGWEFFEARGM